MANLYLLRFNNYFNRTVRRLNALSDYAQYVINGAGPQTNPLQNINFNPNDGVTTDQIVNWAGADPDYIVVADEAGNIESRWFVMRHDRTRGQQYRLTLRRDVLVDFYDAIIHAPCFIEKATLPPTNDLIFNFEGMTFNQIKRSEILLKDKTGCPWIVIYASRANYSDAGQEQPTVFECDVNLTYPFTTLTTSEYNDLNSNQRKIFAGNARTTLQVAARSYMDPPWISNYGTEFTAITGDNNIMERYNIGAGNFPENNTFVENAKSVFQQNLKVVSDVNNLANAYFPQYNPAKYNDIISKLNKVYSYGGKYYRVKQLSRSETTYDVPKTASGALITALTPLNDMFMNSDITVGGQYTNDANIHITYRGDAISYVLEETAAPSTSSGIHVAIPQQRYHATDVPYDIFTMPLSDTLNIKNSKVTTWQQTRSDANINLQVASKLLSKYSKAGQIFDAQILPYCPISTYVMNGNDFDLMDSSLLSYSKFHEVDGSFVGYLFHVTAASFNAEISPNVKIDPQDLKIESQTQMHRFCSPNYASIFEMNAAMNGGIRGITASCTYKPFDPYIKVYPEFGRLYGNSYNDARGLILGGDFSLATLNDAWQTYKLQNKNFQEIFDRQVQNMEIHNKYGKISDIANAVTGTMTGAASGALATGNPAGAVLGGLASGVAGAYDAYVNDKLRKEDLQYTKDRFAYELGNIKALPQTLTRTSAYNIDNKYFPFLEFYDCSEPEKEALAEKIRYTGMTVMTVGTVGEYIQSERTYIKGQLIRMTDISDSYNVAREIYEELNKGVYI